MTIRRTAALLAFLAVCAAHAEDPPGDAEIRRLQSFLQILNSELAVEYEHVKAVQQAIAMNGQSTAGNPARSPDVTNYEDNVEQRRRVLEREDALRRQLDASLARIKDIEAQKAPILDRVRELMILPAAAVVAPVPAPAAASPPAPAATGSAPAATVGPAPAR